MSNKDKTQNKNNINYRAAKNLIKFYEGPPNLDDLLNFLEYVCNIKRSQINIKEVLIYLRLIITPKSQ